MTEHLWLTAATRVPGDRLRHHDHDSQGRSLGGPRRLSPGHPRFHRGNRRAGNASRGGWNSSDRSPMRRRSGRVGFVATGGRGQRDDRPGGRSRRRRSRDGVPRGGPIHGHRGPLVRARRATAAWAPPSDPLGDLARASGFHVRPVTLPEGWWRRHGGEPLLGRLTDAGQCPRGPRCRSGGRRLVLRASLRAARFTKGGGGPSTTSSPGESLPTAWMFYRTLPDSCSRSPTWSRFSLSLPGLGRELVMVLAMAFWRRALRLVDSHRLRNPRRPGHAGSRSAPAGRHVPVPGRHDHRGRDLPGDSGAVGPAHRRAGLGDSDPGGLGSFAPAAEPVFRPVLLGRPGLAGDGVERGLQEGLRGGGGHRRDGLLLVLQPGLALLLQLEDGPVHDAALGRLARGDRAACWRACCDTRPRSARSTGRSPACSWSSWAASSRCEPRGPRAAPSPAGHGATPNGSRCRSVPGDSPTAFTSGWRFIRF